MEKKVVGGSIYILTKQMSGFEEDGSYFNFSCPVLSSSDIHIVELLAGHLHEAHKKMGKSYEMEYKIEEVPHFHNI